MLGCGHALAFDSQGRLYVADRGNHRIQIFDQDGNYIDFGRDGQDGRAAEVVPTLRTLMRPSERQAV